MKLKSLFASILLFVLVTFSALAQTTKEEFYQNSSIFPGYHTPYYGGNDKLTPAPKGYKPVYVYHFGRHGSRFDMNPEHPGKCIEVLEKAKNDDMLTSAGEELLEIVKDFAAFAEGREGQLSVVGQKEHEGIAARMYKNYKSLFGGKDVKVVARTSDVPRCIVSMASFCGELRSLNPKMDISLDSSPTYHKYLKNGSGIAIRDKDYKKYTDKFKDSCKMNPEYLVKMVFKPGYEKKLKEGGRRFMDELMGIYIYFDCTGFGSERIKKYFTDDDRYMSWLSSTYYFYVKYGPSPLFDKYIVGAAHVPVEYFRNCVNEALSGRGPAANLHFSHDSFILPFASLLNINGIDQKETDPEKVSLVFSDYKAVPMAVNIQFIFFKNPKGDVLFKILYNEKEAELPGVEKVCGPYYSWDAVQPYIEERLAKYPAPVAK
ncbi:MAG: hypothetical protein HUJ95_00055 [Bacteroidales bacterium]|nr:hypothetical protein [Bacteroidales bacterium]